MYEYEVTISLKGTHNESTFRMYSKIFNGSSTHTDFIKEVEDYVGMPASKFMVKRVVKL